MAVRITVQSISLALLKRNSFKKQPAILRTMKSSVKINEMFADRPLDEQVAAVARAGVEGIGFRPWYSNDLDTVVSAANTHELSIAYLSGGSEAASGPEFQLVDPSQHEDAIDEIHQMIEVAESVGAATVNIIPGLDRDDIDPATKHTAVVDALREIAPAAEAADIDIVLEPLNVRVDHPGYYLTSSAEAIAIVHAVDSPAVSVLYDIYHQQITEGNIIDTITTHIDAIGHIHLGDVPGRHEPGTGELNYDRIYEAIRATGFDGYVECEFIPKGDPEVVMETFVSAIHRAE